MIHILALVSLVNVGSLPSQRLQTRVCRQYSEGNSKLDNYPPTSTSHRTETVHAAAVYVANSFAGVLFVTREGTIWFLAGGWTQFQGTAAAVNTVNKIMGTNVRLYAIGQVTEKEVVSLLGNNISITSCY